MPLLELGRGHLGAAPLNAPSLVTLSFPAPPSSEEYPGMAHPKGASLSPVGEARVAEVPRFPFGAVTAGTVRSGPVSLKILSTN